MKRKNSAIYNQLEAVENDGATYYGFGGWLIVFALGLTFSFITTLIALYDNYAALDSESYFTDDRSQAYYSLLEGTIVFECIIQIIVILLILLMTYYCIKMDYKFKIISIIYILFLFLFNISDIAVLQHIKNFHPGKIVEDNYSYSNLIRTVLYTGVWIPYFFLSKRVNNTYVKKLKIKTAP